MPSDRKHGPGGPTSLSSWGLAIARALHARGCDAAAIFARAGLDFAALDDPDARLPVRSPSRLWPLAIEATGDPCFGLEVARHTTPTTFHALGFSLAASASLREAFERVARYYRLVSDAAVIRFEAIDDTYRVSVLAKEHASTQLAYEPPWEAIDAILALAVRICRSLTNRSFSPLLVELRRPAPANPTPFHRCFRAPVTFGASRDAMTLDKETCEKRLRGANAELARANDVIAAKALERWDQSRLANRVRALLLEGLPTGAPTQARAAHALGTSTRALQRRLAGEGTSYAALLDATRRELAEAYLRQVRYSVTEIAYLLGFSATASFTRAFRRWNGEAPSDFRRRGLQTSVPAATPASRFES